MLEKRDEAEKIGPEGDFDDSDDNDDNGQQKFVENAVNLTYEQGEGKIMKMT